MVPARLGQRGFSTDRRADEAPLGERPYHPLRVSGTPRIGACLMLRAVSMLVVMLGHWVAAAPHFDGGGVDRRSCRDGSPLDRPARVGRAGHAGLLHRPRICERRELVRRAQGRPIIRQGFVEGR